MTAIDVRPPAQVPPAARDEPPRPQNPLRLRRIRREDVLTLGGSALSGVALTWLLYERLLPTSGALGFWLCCYLAFLGMYAMAANLQWDKRIVVEKLVTVVVASAALLVFGVLFDMIGYVVFRGSKALVHANFFTDSMAFAGPLSPLTDGGAAHAMIGSLEQLGLATLFAVPLGILAALYMAEVGGRMSRVVRTLVDAMTALPSIVAGLFVLSLWVVSFGFQRSGLAASFAITIMMMPIITRAAEIVIRLVPNTLREAAYALGASQWRVAFTVVLPTARSGLTTAVVLAMARGVGETSPVLLTAGFTKEFNSNPLQGPQTNLPVYIFTNITKYPQPNMIARGFGAGLTLVLVVLVLFVTARILGGRTPGELTRRQKRRAPARGERNLMSARPVGGRLVRLAAVVGLLAGATLLRAPTASATTYAVLNGSGSSWAAPAIDQWSEDVRDRGIVVNYSPIGSQEGRSNYTGNIVDFAGSDIAFLNGEDKIAGSVVEHSQYAYSYLPITAGGTAFMYHLTVAGHRITNLRLSGDTITKIFTGQITNWSDQRITKDYGSSLPDEPIVPVIRSDGSGATAQFTAWMNDQYSDQWNSFCSKYADISAKPCGETEFFPTFGNAKAQSSSTASANYVTASSGEGSINYDEYSYALQSGFPVVKLLNPAGYYVLPTAQNDAVALTAAQINTDPKSVNYLTQDLRGVYRNADPRSYPLSSYSYLIVPRNEPARGARPPNFTDAKGATLSTWANYFLCGGQKQMAALGYSPLPINLVRGGLDQVDKIFGAVPTPDRSKLGGCNNPTFQNGKNTLLATAPYPTKCDKLGSPLYGCGTSVSGQQGDGTSTSTGGGGSGNGSGSGTGSGTAGRAVAPERVGTVDQEPGVPARAGPVPAGPRNASTRSPVA